MARTWTALAAGFLCLGWTAGLHAQEFSYGFDGVPVSVSGGPGSTHDLEVGLTIGSSGFEDGAPGPQGWSLGVRNSGVEIQSVTTEGTVAADVSMGGLRNTGFEVFELVDPDAEPANGDLAGQGPQGEGAVQAIVLSFVMDITLPSNETAVIGKVSYTCTIGDADSTATVEFVNGLKGSGQPVSNDITQEGRTVSPSLASATIDKIVVATNEIPGETCLDGLDNDEDGDIDCADDDCRGSADCPVPTDLFLGTAGDVDADSVEINIGDPAATVSVTAYIGPGEDDNPPASGSQGWSLGIQHDGAMLEIISATTLGTIAADVNDDPPGMRNTGFEVSEIVDPARQTPAGRAGLVSAVVLSFVMNITLAPAEDNSVLIATYRAAEGVAAGDGEGPMTTEIEFADGLQGAGQPVQTVLTISGQTVNPGQKHPITVEFTEDVPDVFLRGDANNDGTVNIADPIYTINERVRQGPPFACEKAADSNDDDMVDLSDVMYTIAYRFLAGPTPPPPFVERPASGEQCGAEEFDPDAQLTCDDANCD